MAPQANAGMTSSPNSFSDLNARSSSDCSGKLYRAPGEATHHQCVAGNAHRKTHLCRGLNNHQGQYLRQRVKCWTQGRCVQNTIFAGVCVASTLRLCTRDTPLFTIRMAQDRYALSPYPWDDPPCAQRAGLLPRCGRRQCRAARAHCADSSQAALLDSSSLPWRRKAARGAPGTQPPARLKRQQVAHLLGVPYPHRVFFLV